MMWLGVLLGLRWGEAAGLRGDALIFVSPEGRPLDYSHWRRRIWLPACETAGLAGLGFHDLRRANATGMVADGVDLKTAQSRLGHSDPRMTLAVYAQATQAGDQTAANSLAARFMPDRSAGWTRDGSTDDG